MDDLKETILAIVEHKLLHEGALGLCYAFRATMEEVFDPDASTTDARSYIHTIFPNFNEALGLIRWRIDETGNWSAYKEYYPGYDYVWPCDIVLPRIRFINYLRQSL